MIQEAIGKLIGRQDLDFETVSSVMDEIMTGNATDAQVAAYLTALHMKGETIEEITASAATMRRHGTKLEHKMDVMDIVGTGGDCSRTINISTLAALVAAAGGVKVAKHGNRAASSKCGTADVLEELGVKLDVEPEMNKKMLEEIDICFLFAQKYHSAMKNVACVRKEIKIPTIFNILGPLSSPARANFQLLGVYDENLVEPLAHALSKLGVKRGMVVHGLDRLDEISLSAPTSVCEFDEQGTFDQFIITPEKYGFKRCNKEDLVGGDPKLNAKISLEILNGEKGPKRDAIVLNAAAAFHIYNEVTIEEGIILAEELIDNGKALKKLNEFIEMSNR